MSYYTFQSQWIIDLAKQLDHLYTYTETPNVETSSKSDANVQGEKQSLCLEVGGDCTSTIS